MRSLSTLLVAFLLPVCAAAAADSGDEAGTEAAGQKVTLRYKFQPGETLRWEVVHRARIKTTVGGNAQTAETVSQSVKAWVVREVRDDGTATFEHLVESVNMRQKLTGREEVRYDSRTDKKPPAGFENVAQSIGKPLSVVTLNHRGEVLHRERLDSPASAKNEEGQMTIPLPEKPIAVGDSWSFPHEIAVPVQGTGAVQKVNVLQKFVLKDLSTGIATIKVATQILTPIHDPALEAQLIQRAATGTVRFDVDAGRVVGQQMDLDKVVVGFRGEASSLHYLTRFTEEFLGVEEKTAARESR